MLHPQPCDRCQSYYGLSQPQVCALYPDGPVQIPCMDFTEITDGAEDFGAAWYGNHLITQPRSHLSKAERLQLLETHPFFTGVCPKCGVAISSNNRADYNCDNCGWKTDQG